MGIIHVSLWLKHNPSSLAPPLQYHLYIYIYPTSDLVCLWSARYSFPNLLPLPAFQVQRIRDRVKAIEEEFDRLYGAFATSIVGQAKHAVLESADRYLRALAGDYQKP
jgi:hypothetical protein